MSRAAPLMGSVALLLVSATLTSRTPEAKLPRMTLASLHVACPKCGSSDVVYSCKPECCFNHVCGQCFTTFELGTSRVGEAAGDFGPIPPDPDPSAPTAPHPLTRAERALAGDARWWKRDNNVGYIG